MEDELKNIEEQSKETTVVDMGTLYDVNKGIVAQLNPLSPSKIRESLSNISKYIMSTKNNYYMLLCNDIKYFSLFHIQEPENYKFADNLAKEVKEILEDDLKSTIYAMDADESGGYEFWIAIEKENDEKEFHALYLFPYDSGLIEVRG